MPKRSVVPDSFKIRERAPPEKPPKTEKARQLKGPEIAEARRKLIEQLQNSLDAIPLTNQRRRKDLEARLRQLKGFR